VSSSTQSHRNLPATALAAVCAALLLALPSGAGAASSARVSLSGGITPAFNPAVLDYVTTCVNNHADLSVTAPSGFRAKIDKRPARTGTQTAGVSVRPGQRIELALVKGSKSTSYSIRCLPQDFPNFASTGRLPAGSPYMTFAQLRPLPRAYMVVVDSRGTPVWWLKTGINSDVKPLGHGTIGSWSGGPIDSSAQAGVGHFIVYSLAGKALHSVTTGTDTQDNHETLPSSNGEWYVDNYILRDHVDLSAFGMSADANVYDGVIRRVSATGQTLWSWSSKDHIGLAETGVWWNVLKEPWKVFGGFVTDVPADLVHLNSIADDGKGGLIVSFRHLSAIYRIIKATGQIDWKLGGTPTSKSLTVLGDNANSPHMVGQHDARVLPDGTITAFDNGWPVYENGITTGHPPRAVRWKINPAARTATLVEQVTDPEVPTGNCCGNARRLADGTWVIHWGVPFTRAYGPAPAHKVLFALHMTDGVSYSYRSVPIAPTQMTRSQIMAGMDAQFPR